MNPIIEVNNLTKYYEKLPVLDKLTFDVKDGEFISVIGPSGCGKTTLLKILGGILTPTSGWLTIKDNSIDVALKQRLLGFMFQNPILFPWLTVRQNIQLPLSIVGREIKDIPFGELWQDIEIEKHFHGWAEFCEATEDIIRSLNYGEEYVILTGEIGETHPKLHDFFLEFHKRRKAKGIKVRSIISEKINKIIQSKGDTQYQYMQYKTIAENYPTGVNIYKDKIIFFTFDKEPHIRLVKSKKLANAYRALFERAWEIDHLPKKLLELVKIRGFEKRYPHELSAGMQSRVALARTLIYDPQIFLMDEPFSALDELTRESLNLELLQIWDQTKKTIIFVTHSIPEAVFLSDRVIVLSERPAKIEKIVGVDLPRPRKTELKHIKKYIELIECLRKILKKD